ncbi:MAG: hypothetical protein IJ371_04255 [Clostridia bacterium]|nr:hypothetical protein [Clostridia bacterium]
MKISIHISSMMENSIITIDSDKHLFRFNGEEVNLNIKLFCMRVIQLTNSWPNAFPSFCGSDCEKYNITIQSNSGKTRTLYSNGLLPDNYKEFRTLIEEAYNARLSI